MSAGYGVLHVGIRAFICAPADYNQCPLRCTTMFSNPCFDPCYGMSYTSCIIIWIAPCGILCTDWYINSHIEWSGQGNPWQCNNLCLAPHKHIQPSRKLICITLLLNISNTVSKMVWNNPKLASCAYMTTSLDAGHHHVCWLPRAVCSKFGLLYNGLGGTTCDYFISNVMNGYVV